MSSLLEQSENKIWIWNKKPMKLKNLTDGQLYSIQQTLIKSKSNWFGQSKESWLNAITPILKSRQEKNINQIVIEMDQRRRLRISNDIESQLHAHRLRVRGENPKIHTSRVLINN